MTLENALNTYLKANSALVSACTGGIHWMQAPQTSTTPYLVYQLVTDSDEALSFGNTDTGSATVQFAVVCATKTQKSILYQVRALMRNIKGTQGGIVIETSLPGGIRETYNEDTNKYLFYCDYIVGFSYV